MSKDVINLGLISSEGWDSEEFVIENYMVLGRDVAGGEVQNKRHKGGVFRRKTNKHSLASTSIPFRNTLAILKVRVENIHRATKDMGTS
jgi:hypothetical protein